MKRNKDDLTASETLTAKGNEEEVVIEDLTEAIDQSVVADDSADSKSDLKEFPTRTSTIDNSIMAYGQKSSTFFKTGKTDGAKTQIDRFYPDVESGLSGEQVGIRIAQGLNNVSKISKGNTYKNIFFSNIFTFFKWSKTFANPFLYAIGGIPCNSIHQFCYGTHQITCNR